ncbi:MAG: subtilisin family serine protease [Cyclobacteriaceae bacterium]|jgi:subtilisin family serine protease
MIKAIVIKVIFLLVFTYDICGQKKYWIDNDNPQIQKLIDSLQLNPQYCSDWAQACSYFLDKNQVDFFKNKIEILPVLKLKPLSTRLNKCILSFALEQIEAQSFIDKNLNGNGVKIGIIDGGFLKADKDETLSHFFSSGNEKVHFYKDYVTPEMAPYGGSFGLDDGHGTEVWQLIGGYNPTKNIQYGLATEAIYYLARTDHGGYEKRLEEDYIIQAMEEMAKMGVRLFNISLGYTEDYTDKTENYLISDVDGKSSMLTRALDKAASQHGLLFVISAGNDGAAAWQTLSIPADAKNALTVGASKFKIWDKINYSSIGPETLDYVKPNISVYSTLGTSFTAPIVTGLAACMIQYDSTLTNFEIMDILEKASNFYPFANNYVGYGVPTCSNIIKLLEGKENELIRPEEIHTTKNSVKIKVSNDVKTVVVFHKKDERNVMHRINLKPHKNKVQIAKTSGSQQCSVLLETEVIEIFWED